MSDPLARARNARAAGDHEQALLWFSVAALSNIWARMEACVELLALGRDAEAEAAYRSVLAEAPGQPVALLGLANCARRRGDLAASLALHRQILAADPAHVWARLQEAADLAGLKRTAEASDAYAAVLAVEADNLGALLGLGQCARQAGDRAAACDWHARAASAHPHQDWPHITLAEDLRALGRLDEAVESLGLVLARAPDSVAALLGLARVHRDAGRGSEAALCLRRAAAADPADIQIKLDLAGEERALGNLAACDAVLAEALALAPGHPAILLRQADSARLAGDVARMRAILAEARDAHPGDPALALAQADALAMDGQPEAAFAVLEALEAHPAQAPAARIKHVGLLRAHGFWPEALARARATTHAHPTHLAGWMERLATETLVGGAAEIEACLAAAPAATPAEHAWVARLRGRVLEDRGAWDAAAESYALSAQLDPGRAETAFMRTRLALVMLDLPAARAALRDYVRLAPAGPRGRAAQPSQTHYGQILDEYLLDRETVQALLPVRALPPEDRIPPLLRLIAAHPDSTAAAVSLVQAVRGCGRAAPAAPSGEHRHIPKTIVQFWDRAEIPPDIAAIMSSWGAQHPGYRIEVYDDAAARAFIGQAHGPMAARLFATLRIPAQRADVFRLAYLAARGGIHADADDRCHAPVGTIIPPGARLVVYQEDLGTLGNNFIAAAPGDPVLVRAFNLAMLSIARGDQDTLWLSTGPGLLTRAFAQTLAARAAAQGEAAWPGWFDRITVLPGRALFRVAAIHCSAAYKSSGLHWGNAGAGQAKDNKKTLRGVD